MGKWEEPDLDSRASDYKEAAGNHAHGGGPKSPEGGASLSCMKGRC